MSNKKIVKKNHGQKNYHAVALGERGGLVGGPARAAALSPAQRSAIARKGGKAKAAGRDS